MVEVTIVHKDGSGTVDDFNEITEVDGDIVVEYDDYEEVYEVGTITNVVDD